MEVEPASSTVAVLKCILVYVTFRSSFFSFNISFQANGAGGTSAAVNALAAADCEVAITELDIEQASSNDYTTVLRACLNQSRCVAITSWGVSDAVSYSSIR